MTLTTIESAIILKLSIKYDNMSFSNYMEGFARDDECEASLKADRREILCGADPENEIRRRLHNLVRILCRHCSFAHFCVYVEVHVLVGFNGTIGEIPIAANDPVFINHHTMIDCLFEQWLTSHTNRTNMYPASLDAQFAGHAANDCIVPFIPLYTHEEVFLKSADDYGYRCDLPLFVPPTGTGNPSNPPATNPPGRPGNPGNQPGNPGNGADSSLASATMLISMIVVCLVAIVV